MLTLDKVEATVDAIAAVQLADGSVPWFPGGQMDPWNHVEALMALTIGGRIEAAERGFQWLIHNQRPDGSWHASYRDGEVIDATLDTNVCAYVATGAHLHHLATGDDAPGFPIGLIDRTTTEYVWGGLRIVQDRLYVPVASYCDAPDDEQVAADGRLIAVDLSSLTPAGAFDSVPGFGFLGGFWGWGGVSAEPDGSVVYSAVGNSSVYSAECDCMVDDAGYGDSVVALTPDLQTVLDSNRPATVPNVGDADFGAAPLLFQPPGCPPLAAANNKTGELYVWDRRALGAGPIATVGLGDASAPFVGAPSYDPSNGLIFESQVFMTDSDTGRKYGVAALAAGDDCTFQIVWRAAFGSGSQAPPIVVGDVVLVGGGFDGGFAAFDSTTGQLLWSYASDAPTLAPLASAGGSVFGADLDGNVYAFAVGAGGQ